MKAGDDVRMGIRLAGVRISVRWASILYPYSVSQMQAKSNRFPVKRTLMSLLWSSRILHALTEQSGQRTDLFLAERLSFRFHRLATGSWHGRRFASRIVQTLTFLYMSDSLRTRGFRHHGIRGSRSRVLGWRLGRQGRHSTTGSFCQIGIRRRTTLVIFVVSEIDATMVQCV
jgi:hypothetical protein